MDLDQPLAPGTLLENRYRVRGVLGQGGMSRVYLADAIHLGMLVAVKENLQNSAEARSQFDREAQLLARLSHPNIPRVIDRFTTATTGRQYLVMEYVEGEDLAAMIRRVGPLPESTTLAWIGQILDAVDYLHRQQPPVIHRDIKPANIKITSQGRAVLVDFGISKFYDASRGTVTGLPAVTAGYAPPEQYGFRTTQRSDIYALGATLYTMLTGRVPPDAPLRQAGEEMLAPPHQLVPVSAPVENAVLRALQIENTSRWQSIGEMRAALEGRLSDKRTVTDAGKTRLVSKVPFERQPPLSQAVLSASKKSAPVPWWILALVGATVGVCILLFLVVAIVKITPSVALVPTQIPATAPMTATASRTPESTATPFADAVIEFSVDLHTGPSYASDVQGTLQSGDRIQALARSTTSVFGMNSDWVLIRTSNGKQGWVNANQIKWNITLSAIPVTVIPTETRVAVSIAPTATATRVPSVIPIPTTAPTASPMPTSIFLLADDFVDNRNAWQTATGKAYFEGGAFHVLQPDSGYSYWVSCSQCGPFTDFVYEAMIQKIDGTDNQGYGLIYRNSIINSKRVFYAFEISGNGSWVVDKLTADGWQNMSKWTSHTAVNKGNGKNKLRVTGKGSRFDFYINDQLVGSANDDTFSTGTVGFGVGTTGLHIRVDYVRVWNAPSVLSTAPTPTVPGPHLASCNDTPPGMAGLLWINQFDGEATVTIVDHEYHVPGNSRMLIPIPAGQKFVIDAFVPGVGRLRPAPGPFTWDAGYCETWNPGRSTN